METIHSSNNDSNFRQLRVQFPVLNERVYGKPLVYFDNGATTQKPIQVIAAMDEFYKHYNSNVHRGVHFMSGKATDAFEAVRKKVQRFINAKHEHEIIYTSGTTGSVNLVAAGFGKVFLKHGDAVLISSLEHHSNIVPWQMAAESKGARIKVIPLNSDGDLDLSNLDTLLDDVKIVAVNYVSNALGTVNPVREIIEKAHARNIPVLLDAAQAVQHMIVDVQELDVDFLTFSGHKVYGPTGSGVLYGKEKWLEQLPPLFGGGEMIKTVTFEKTVYNELPFKFEAGTPPIAEIIGLGAAIDFVQSVGLENIQEHESKLLQHAVSSLEAMDGIRLIGTPKHRSGVVSFLMDGCHPFDVGEILDKQGIAVRTGHHCAEPLMNLLGVPGTVRASFALYNTLDEIDLLLEGLKNAKKVIG